LITLAIETSCDETSAAVLENGRVISNIISTQLFHSQYGGVVPEVASREHLKKITIICQTALERGAKKLGDVNLICATTEPGLIGALLVGSNFAKGLSVALQIPFISVNHIQAHLYSPFIENPKIEFPFIGLIVSGGHTLLILAEDLFRHKIIGRTIDDAAGEAFDKVAKLLGLGYPGGKLIDEAAKIGDPAFYKFPKANIKDSEFDFSFSGIKTSVLYYLRKNYEGIKLDGQTLNNICASFQDAVIGMLFEKTKKAAEKFNVKTIAISGGVSANSQLRERFNFLTKNGYAIMFPSNEFTTDNAAMIGLAGYLKYNSPDSCKSIHDDQLQVHAKPRLDYENF
jgi:N6-L-threonylcarbamoyladenine synthase